MLDVHGGPDVDARRAQLLDVLPAFRMARFRCIGVGQLVHQHQRGRTFQNCIEVHFCENLATVGDFVSRYYFERGQQGFGLDAAVSFDNADDDINARGKLFSALFQHLICFAYARRGPKEYLQRTAPLPCGFP